MKTIFSKHFYCSLVNSGVVTVFTSITMTALNAAVFSSSTWYPNWLISWGIVFCYVYVVAPVVSRYINSL